MLTNLLVRRFKQFEEVSIELASPVVFIGPNDSGKTTALQALALWEIGLRRWNEKRAGKTTPEKRPGVTVNRRDLITVPVPDAVFLWHDLGVRNVTRDPVFEQAEIDRRTRAMQASIEDLVPPVALRDPTDRWWSDTQASDDFFDRLFEAYYARLELPNLMRKSDYHQLAEHVPLDLLDAEVSAVLDGIHDLAEQARIDDLEST